MKRDEVLASFEDDWFLSIGELVMGVIIQSQNGRSAKDIAEILSFDVDVVTESLRRLSLLSLIEHRRVQMSRPIWVATETAIRGQSDRRYWPQQRKCMCCDSSFLSTDAGNRICDDCKHNDAEDDMEMAA